LSLGCAGLSRHDLFWSEPNLTLINFEFLLSFRVTLLQVTRFPVSDSDSQNFMVLSLDNLLTHKISTFLILSKRRNFENTVSSNYVNQSTWLKSSQMKSVPIASFLCSTTIPSPLDDFPQRTLASCN
jgi:hypothetical protein